jgi:ornithine cyclodeaminase
MPLLLTESDVRRVLSMRDLIALMREALAAFSRGDVVQPVRLGVKLGNEPALLGLMPAYAPRLPALGAKLVTVFHRNAQRGLPTHLATILLFNPDTGELLALVDGRFITEVLTAAVSAVSVDHLATPEARTLAILGSGVQARSHLEALRLVRSFDRISAWSPTPGHLASFVSDAQAQYGVRVETATSAEAAVRDADVVVLAASVSTPILQNAWVKDGAHVVSLGAIIPTQREMDPALVERSRLIVDSRAAALTESGDIVLGIREGRFQESHIRAELGEIAGGGVAGRVNGRDVTIFKSLGLAIEDLVAAHYAYGRAGELGLGTHF